MSKNRSDALLKDAAIRIAGTTPVKDTPDERLIRERLARCLSHDAEARKEAVEPCNEVQVWSFDEHLCVLPKGHTGAHSSDHNDLTIYRLDAEAQTLWAALVSAQQGCQQERAATQYTYLAGYEHALQTLQAQIEILKCYTQHTPTCGMTSCLKCGHRIDAHDNLRVMGYGVCLEPSEPHCTCGLSSLLAQEIKGKNIPDGGSRVSSSGQAGVISLGLVLFLAGLALLQIPVVIVTRVHFKDEVVGRPMLISSRISDAVGFPKHVSVVHVSNQPQEKCPMRDLNECGAINRARARDEEFLTVDQESALRIRSSNGIRRFIWQVESPDVAVKRVSNHRGWRGPVILDLNRHRKVDWRGGPAYGSNGESRRRMGDIEIGASDGFVSRESRFIRPALQPADPDKSTGQERDGTSQPNHPSIGRRFALAGALFLGGLLLGSRCGQDTDYSGRLLRTDYLGLLLIGLGLFTWWSL